MGYSRSEIMGMNYPAYTSPRTAKKMFRIFNQVYRTGKPAKITDRTRAVFINSPSNPTGNLLSQDRMKAIADLADTPGAPYIVSDEIYHGLVYEGREHSILEYTDRAFVLNGFSKLYAMTGLRLGYLIAPKPFIRSIQKIQQNFFISANSLAQKAGIAALRAELIRGRYHIMHTFNNKAVSNGLRACKALPVKVVCYRGIVGNLIVLDPMSWMRYLNPRIDRIICVCEAIRQWFLHMQPAFLRMLADVVRFNREACRDLDAGIPEPTLGAYLDARGLPWRDDPSNQDGSNAQLVYGNYTKRPQIRINTTIGVTYDTTADKIETAVEKIPLLQL